MDQESQRGNSDHLDGLAAAELAVANRQLAEAGATIEELRADAIALARRIDEARAETLAAAEKFRFELNSARTELEGARTSAANESDEVDRLRATVSQLEAHVARLKQQIQNPGKLVVKKALRRGHFKPDAS